MWIWTAYGYRFVPAYAPYAFYPPAPAFHPYYW
jgi:hypothetical protein